MQRENKKEEENECKAIDGKTKVVFMRDFSAGADGAGGPAGGGLERRFHTAAGRCGFFSGNSCPGKKDGEETDFADRIGNFAARGAHCTRGDLELLCLLPAARGAGGGDGDRAGV